MKKLMMVIGVLGMVMSAGLASALPSGSWVSGVTVQNLSDIQVANITIDFYSSSGSNALAFTPTGGIEPGKSKTWYLPTQVTSLASGFVGSAVVSSDQAVAAIVNTQLPSGSNPARVGTSAGVSTPQTKMYAPQVLKAGPNSSWNSYCSVQNTSAAADNVTAKIYNASGTLVDTQVEPIAGFGSFIFDQSTRSALSANFTGSAEFTSVSAPLAVVCNFYNAGTDPATSQFHSYNGMSSGGDTIYLPRLVKDYSNYQSGMKVQNIGTETLTVNVTYNFGGAEYSQTSTAIGPGQSWGPYMGASAQLPASMAAVKGSGSAVVEIVSPNANKKIIATVNEDNRVSPSGRGVTYEGALSAEGSNKIVFPQVTSEFYGFSSGIQVTKVEAGTTSCTATYSASGSVTSPFDVAFTLSDVAPSWSQFAPNASGMKPGIANDNYNGSVTVNCTGAKVVGIANISARYDVDNRYVIGGDSFACYRGLAN